MLFKMKSDPIRYPAEKRPKPQKEVTASSSFTGSFLWLPGDILFYLRRRAGEKAVETFTASIEEQPVVMISEKEEIRWQFYFQVGREISTIALKF